MPEGPEIHRAAQRLRNALEGSIITHVECPYTTIQGQEHRFLGNQVISIEARSKAMLIHICEDVLYSHNQLYGRWTVQKNSTKPKKTNRSLRIKLQNETHTACLYSATDIQIIEPWEIEGHPYIAKLGPDVANNYLRSEILHSARINPSRKLNTLSEIEQNNLAHSAIEVTQLAYEQRGVTVEKGLYDLLRENGLSRRQARHHVFTRDGLQCHECKSTITHTRMSGRRLDFCPSCQR